MITIGNRCKGVCTQRHLHACLMSQVCAERTEETRLQMNLLRPLLEG